jgi:hypothetical protein
VARLVPTERKKSRGMSGSVVIDLTAEAGAAAVPKPARSGRLAVGAGASVVDLTSDEAVVVYQPPPAAGSKRKASANVAADNTKIAEDLVGLLTCPVCLDSPMTEMSSTLCGHLFCKPCIQAAIAAAHACPTCKAKLKKGSFHRVYF